MATASGFPQLLIEQEVGGDYPLSNPGVSPRNLLELLGSTYKGGDRPLPNVTGDPSSTIVPLPRFLAPGFHLVELVVKGQFDTDGAVAANPQGQAWLNFVELREAVQPISDGDGLRLCSLQFPPDGSTVFVADCHVGPLEAQGADGPNIFATLEIAVPYGQFEDMVS